MRMEYVTKVSDFQEKKKWISLRGVSKEWRREKMKERERRISSEIIEREIKRRGESEMSFPFLPNQIWLLFMCFMITLICFSFFLWLMNRKEFLSFLFLSDFRIFLEGKKKEGKEKESEERNFRKKKKDWRKKECLEGMKSEGMKLEGSLRKKFGSKNLLTGGVIS